MILYFLLRPLKNKTPKFKLPKKLLVTMDLKKLLMKLPKKKDMVLLPKWLWNSK